MKRSVMCRIKRSPPCLRVTAAVSVTVKIYFCVTWDVVLHEWLWVVEV